MTDPKPLPALPTDTTTWTNAEASVETVAGQRLLILPFAAPIGSSRGRRFLVRLDDEASATQRIVMSLRRAATLSAPDGLPSKCRTVGVAIRALPQTRSRRLPQDLADRIAELGLTVEEAPEVELQQLVVMVNESATQEVRRARLAAALQVIVGWTRDE